MSSKQCAALVIAAPASGQGKTTLTATLAWHYRRQGKIVRLFKVGPDFLDPMILSYAADSPVYQLDLWMVGHAESQRRLARAAIEADLILIEGVMGLFDGTPSTADLAAAFNIPVLAIIDASAMAQTFAAIAYGLKHFRPDIHVTAVLANRVGSERHAQMLIDALPADLPCLATMQRQIDSLPSRYLGLVQADEIDNLSTRLDQLADQILVNRDIVLPLIEFETQPEPIYSTVLKGVRIGVAKDAAFAFIYQANLDCLISLGAELIYFSPLVDKTLPDVDSLYLPGGYPELHLSALNQNQSLIRQIKQHIDADKPVLAECGGMLFLCESLTDKAGVRADMCGVLAANAVLQKRLTALALQAVAIDGQVIRGHSYHHSILTTNLTPVAYGECPNGHAVHEAVYQQNRLTASYIHFYFDSCPSLIAKWFAP